ncbi:MAG: Rnf-Nqr domain containing protein, partial [Gammaproteobacteria bacterium]
VSSELLLTNLIGVCPLLAVTKKLETAAGLAAAILLVQPIALGLFLGCRIWLPPSFATAEVSLPLIVLCNLAVVHGLTVVGQYWPLRLFRLARPFMSLLNVNCIVLGITLITIGKDGGVLFALSLAIGYALSLIVVAEITERLSANAVPKCMQGAPIILLTMGIVSLALQSVHG